jgi:hypothetical protein
MLRNKMDGFEQTMDKLLNRTQNYTLTEFFLEKNMIMDEVNRMKKDINSFSTYCPSFSVRFEDDKVKIKETIEDDLKKKLEKYIV